MFFHLICFYLNLSLFIQKAHPGGSAPTGCALLYLVFKNSKKSIKITMSVCLTIIFFRYLMPTCFYAYFYSARFSSCHTYYENNIFNTIILLSLFLSTAHYCYVANAAYILFVYIPNPEHLVMCELFRSIFRVALLLFYHIQQIGRLYIRYQNSAVIHPFRCPAVHESPSAYRSHIHPSAQTGYHTGM